MGKEDEVAAGFDIGTTTSCAAIWINDRVEIIPDTQTGFALYHRMFHLVIQRSL